MTFDRLMLTSSNYCNGKKMVDKWKVLEDLYNNRARVGTQVIPKIIHQIWLGSPVNESIAKFVESIKNANKEYTHILWTDDSVKQFEFKNKDIYNTCKNFGQKSDILRYAILEKFGGIYLDTDFVGVKNFNELLHHNFFTGVAYDSEPTLFNGLIGCVPNHPLTYNLNMLEAVEDYDGMAIIKSTGPWYLTKKLFKYANGGYRDAITLPLAYFYPYPNFDKDKTLGNDYRKYIKEQTICVHLWDSRWN